MTRKHFTPRGWKRISLHELAKVQTGIAKGKKNIQNPVERPYLRVANVQDGRLDLREMKNIVISRKDIDRYKLQQDDVLMTEGGDYDKLGRGFVWQDEIKDCLHQNHVFAVRPTGDRLDPFFLTYQAGSSYGKRYFLNCSKQSTNLASINSTQLKEFPVLLPPIDEQKLIVNIIKNWDHAITLAEDLITSKQRKRLGLMQQLLTGKWRFPGYIDSWRNVHLGEIFKNRTESGREDLPLLSITGDCGVVSRNAIDRRDTSSVDKSRYLRICPGDIGYNTMRMWQGVSGLSSLEGIVSPAYTIVTPDESLDPNYMAVFFKYPPIVNLFRRYSQGLVDDTLNLKFRHFAEIKVSIPEKDEQIKIASVFKLLDREIELLQHELTALKEQKKGLMQQLLTGKKRVKATEAA